jgi:cytochrome P450
MPTLAPVVPFDPFSPEFREDPYPTYARMRGAGPVIATPFGALLVTRYEAVDRILRSAAFRTPRGYRDPDDPSGPPMFAPFGALSRHRRQWILFQSGDAHARLRKLVTKVFTPRAVRALVPRIEVLAASLIAPAIDRGSMEVIGELAYPLPATVICELLGIPEGDRDRNRAWAAAIAPTLEPIITDSQIAAAEAAMTAWDAYVRDLMAARRRAPRTGLLDDMLAVEEEGARLTDDEIAANTTFLFLAGHETTTNLVGNGLLALMRHADQLEVLRAEPGLVEGAVEELLRFDSPVQFTGRVAVEATSLEGVRLATEQPVLLALGSANRDERRHDHPDALDVRRADAKPLSFGGGAHYCVGAALARAEAKAVFEQLVARTRGIEPAAGGHAWRPGINLRALSKLHVTFTR